MIPFSFSFFFIFPVYFHGEREDSIRLLASSRRRPCIPGILAGIRATGRSCARRRPCSPRASTAAAARPVPRRPQLSRQLVRGGRVRSFPGGSRVRAWPRRRSHAGHVQAQGRDRAPAIQESRILSAPASCGQRSRRLRPGSPAAAPPGRQRPGLPGGRAPWRSAASIRPHDGSPAAAPLLLGGGRATAPAGRAPASVLRRPCPGRPATTSRLPRACSLCLPKGLL